MHPIDIAFRSTECRVCGAYFTDPIHSGQARRVCGDVCRRARDRFRKRAERAAQAERPAL